QVEKDSRQLILPRSEVLRREVYVKELKGEMMVRKLVLWKTNKDQATEDYPAYVVHLTDFSPNRKDPLCREMRVSSSLEQIQQLCDQLKAENITKGWNAHACPPAAAVVPAPVTEIAVPASAPFAAEIEAEPATAKKPKRKFASSDAESPAPAKAKPKKK